MLAYNNYNFPFGTKYIQYMAAALRFMLPLTNNTFPSP